MAQADDAWTADWESLSAAQRKAWQASSPDDRLRWLEEALDFALEAGALAQDRRRRAAEAQRQWEAMQAEAASPAE